MLRTLSQADKSFWLDIIDCIDDNEIMVNLFDAIAEDMMDYGESYKSTVSMMSDKNRKRILSVFEKGSKND